MVRRYGFKEQVIADMAPDSPIATEALQSAAEHLERSLRLARRVPDALRCRIVDLRDRVQHVVTSGRSEVAERVALVRALESMDAELSGRDALPVRLYVDGRLGTIWQYDPIRIQGAVDSARTEAHVARYLERIVRAEARFHWFYVRAGLEEEGSGELKPWEKPYASLEEDHELIWGRVTGSKAPDEGRSR